MYKISIIIPVYNASKYLEECIKSLQNQTIGFENLEIIMADDCSTDGSRNIMKRLEEQYNNIKCIYLEKNSGAGGKPRNEAMRIATAKYVMFLDSDDVYYDNACLALFEAMQCINADCISGYYSIFDKDRIWEENALSGRKIENKLYYIPDNVELISNFQSHFACKIYKREVIERNEIYFPEGIIGQDIVFFWRYLCNIYSIYYMPIPILKYRQRNKENKSVSYILTVKYFKDTLQVLELVAQYFIIKGFEDKIKYALKNTNDYFISQLINSELSRDNIYVFLGDWMNIIAKCGVVNNGDVYSRIIMDDISIGNTEGASNKIILLRELKNYYNEIWDAKTYFENQLMEIQKTKEWLEKQVQYKDIRIKELENAVEKQNEGKKWLESQYENIKAEYDKLKQWCDEMQQGKDWMEKQNEDLKGEYDKLKQWCDEMQQGKDWMEKQNEDLKGEYSKLKQWCDEVQQGKDWLENEWKNKCIECEELKTLLQNK